MQLYIPQLEELKRRELADIARLNWQVAQSLMGYADDHTVLVGDAVDEHELKKKYKDKKKNLVLATLPAIKTFMYCYSGDYNLGAKLAISNGDEYIKSLPGASFGMWETFTRAVCLYAMARITRKRKYKSPAEHARKTIQQWADRGNPNINHHLLLLNAEHAALAGKESEARRLYGSAISTAARGGFIHDAALANERYADYVKESDIEESKYRIQEAIRFYTAWGASFKVDQLQHVMDDYRLTVNVPGSFDPKGFASRDLSSIFFLSN